MKIHITRRKMINFTILYTDRFPTSLKVLRPPFTSKVEILLLFFPPQCRRLSKNLETTGSDNLKQRIQNFCREIGENPGILERARIRMRKRVRACIGINGRHFENPSGWNNIFPHNSETVDFWLHVYQHFLFFIYFIETYTRPKFVPSISAHLVHFTITYHSDVVSAIIS